MRVLYLSQLMPYPPDAGAKVRQYYTLRYLSQNHDVTLVAFTRPDDLPEGKTHLESFCEAVYTVPMVRSRLRDGVALARSWIGGESFIIRRDNVPQMTRLMEEELLRGDYDIVHADQLWMAQYALLAKEMADSGKIERPRLVLDEHNACYQIFERLAEGERNILKRFALDREWRALKRFEARACSEFDHVVTVTERDQDILTTLVAMVARVSEAAPEGGENRPEFTTIPICADTSSVPVVNPVQGSMDVLHLGTMFWPPNVEGVLWFANQVWPLVRAQASDATFTIVGKSPTAAVRSLASDENGIEVKGYVPEPTPYLERAGVYVVPLFSGSGMRVKIINGWQWGLPTVSTTIGAEGINYLDGDNILIADDAQGFADAVLRVLQDPEIANDLRRSGRRWVEERYDWQRVYPAWESVYEG